MRLTFNRPAFAALLAVTAVEALIATLGKPYPLLRGFVGDVVAVGWAYLVYRSFIRAGVLPLAIAALLTGYAVELGQYLARHYGWRLEQPVLRVILGSVPDWWDMLAYTLGFLLVLLLAGARRMRSPGAGPIQNTENARRPAHHCERRGSVARPARRAATRRMPIQPAWPTGALSPPCPAGLACGRRRALRNGARHSAHDEGNKGVAWRTASRRA
ncbi:DUF2809 domain-containing protein [Achromobacter xylosoxidans]|uniref:ribosomal maturation YjgA family protein n=2 Tax=Alcaligenaceae TaxID=506 RepID=UPI003A4C6039